MSEEGATSRNSAVLGLPYSRREARANRGNDVVMYCAWCPPENPAKLLVAKEAADLRVPAVCPSCVQTGIAPETVRLPPGLSSARREGRALAKMLGVPYGGVGTTEDQEKRARRRLREPVRRRAT